MCKHAEDELIAADAGPTPPLSPQLSPQAVTALLPSKPSETGGSCRLLSVFGGSTPVSGGTHFEVSTQSTLFEAICAFTRKHGPGGSLRVIDPSLSGGGGGEPSDEPKVDLKLAFGEFFLSWEGRTVKVTHQGFGEPH